MGEFARLLEALRDRVKLTKYALAKRAGLTHQALSHLESGLREPSWSTIRRLRQALGCSFEDLDDGSIAIPDEAESAPKPRGRPAKGKKAGGAGPRKRKP
jgi:transcriptional regulator with XRE-family HTH domain